jgi:hypothetical protein
MDAQAMSFEPLFLEPVFLDAEPARPTEAGKRWLDHRLGLISRFADVLRDVGRVARIEAGEWDPRLDALRDAGIPMAASGISQSVMQKVLDYLDGKTTTAFNPAATAMALGTAAPTSTTTGAWGTTESTNYTGYARLAITPGSQLAAATAATPAVVTNSANLQFAGCTASSATEAGFLIVDNVTIGSGTAYFFGSLATTTIDTTHTPPLIAAGALSLSVNAT